MTRARGRHGRRRPLAGLTVAALVVALVAGTAALTWASGAIQGPATTSAASIQPPVTGNPVVNTLLGRMSLAEKFRLLEWVTAPGQPQTAVLPGLRRLGISPLHLAEGPLGTVRQPLAAMTVPLGVAATFSRADAYANGAVLGQDARALGQQAVARPFGAIDTGAAGDPAGASFGEDPLLAGGTAAAEIAGIQAQGTMAVADDYPAGPGSPGVVPSSAALHEIYLQPVEDAVRAGAAGVVCSPAGYQRRKRRRIPGIAATPPAGAASGGTPSGPASPAAAPGTATVPAGDATAPAATPTGPATVADRPGHGPHEPGHGPHKPGHGPHKPGHRPRRSGLHLRHHLRGCPQPRRPGAVRQPRPAHPGPAQRTRLHRLRARRARGQSRHAVAGLRAGRRGPGHGPGSRQVLHARRAACRDREQDHHLRHRQPGGRRRPHRNGPVRPARPAARAPYGRRTGRRRRPGHLADRRGRGHPAAELRPRAPAHPGRAELAGPHRPGRGPGHRDRPFGRQRRGNRPAARDPAGAPPGPGRRPRGPPEFRRRRRHDRHPGPGLRAHP